MLGYSRHQRLFVPGLKGIYYGFLWAEQKLEGYEYTVVVVRGNGNGFDPEIAETKLQGASSPKVPKRIHRWLVRKNEQSVGVLSRVLTYRALCVAQQAQY